MEEQTLLGFGSRFFYHKFVDEADRGALMSYCFEKSPPLNCTRRIQHVRHSSHAKYLLDLIFLDDFVGDATMSKKMGDR